MILMVKWIVPAGSPTTLALLLAPPVVFVTASALLMLRLGAIHTLSHRGLRRASGEQWHQENQSSNEKQ
jgi:hypothetical protein